MKRIALILAMVFLTTASAHAAETWAQRLGYPPDKRVLILYAHHMGAAYEFNRPGEQLLSQNLVQSAGVMVPCPWFHEFAKWYRQHPGYDVGVCLSLTCPSDIYRWRPLSPRKKVPSLVDADGYLWRTVLQFTLRAEPDEVKREMDAQINAARRAGIRPSHLVCDMGSLLTRPDLTRLYLNAAETVWIPAVIPELTPAMVEDLREDGFPLSQETIDVVRRYPLPKLDDLQFVPEAESYTAKREAFYQLVRGLAPGLTQIILHPADRTKALQLVSPRWQDRVWEAQLLLDPEVQEFLDEQGVMMTNWIDIMARFESGDRFPTGASSEKQPAVKP